MDRQNELPELSSQLADAVRKVSENAVRKAMARGSQKAQSWDDGELFDPKLVPGLLRDLQKLKSAVTQLHDRGIVTESDQEVLKSLYFNGIKARHTKVDRAHSKTFGWIFDPEESQIRFRD